MQYVSQMKSENIRAAESKVAPVWDWVHTEL